MRVPAGVLFVVVLGCTPPAVESTHLTSPTIVSLTFDDTLTDQFQVAAMASARGMHVTFYVNSGRVNLASFMSQGQLLSIQQQGHEIAGHTVSHADLPTLDPDEETRQICNDRVALLGLGFNVYVIRLSVRRRERADRADRRRRAATTRRAASATS